MMLQETAGKFYELTMNENNLLTIDKKFNLITDDVIVE